MHTGPEYSISFAVWGNSDPSNKPVLYLDFCLCSTPPLTQLRAEEMVRAFTGFTALQHQELLVTHPYFERVKNWEVVATASTRLSLIRASWVPLCGFHHALLTRLGLWGGDVF